MMDAVDHDQGPEDPASYAEALRELDAILADLERDAADVDRLVAEVDRASHLLAWCRSRLDRASLEIERVVATLDEPTTG